MPQTVVALYRQLPDARRVVDDLIAAGFEREAISLVVADPDEEHADLIAAHGDEDETARGDGMAQGAMIGGALGGLAGLLFGLAAFSIPGLGPLIVAGPLYTAVMGAGVGGLSGGLLGALAEVGVPETEAAFYEEGVRRGHALVALATDDVRRARAIMKNHAPLNVRQVAAEWQAEGWEAPGELPDAFIPSADEPDEHRYATGAMGSDLYGAEAGRDAPLDEAGDADLTA